VFWLSYVNDTASLKPKLLKFWLSRVTLSAQTTAKHVGQGHVGVWQKKLKVGNPVRLSLWGGSYVLQNLTLYVLANERQNYTYVRTGSISRLFSILRLRSKSVHSTERVRTRASSKLFLSGSASGALPACLYSLYFHSAVQIPHSMFPFLNKVWKAWKQL
jgi:hypothetical protein